MWFYLILFAPLLGAALNGLVLRNADKRVSHVLGSGVMGLAFIGAVLSFTSFMSAGGETRVIHAFDWIAAGGFEAPMRFIYDRLSGFMSLIVTGIGFLIHVYAGGYMHEEEKTSRFFAYLNLFVFMMLLLVFGDNMLVMFIGWEGVGLCSYLLIGYWFSEDANAAAGMKAFIVNRIGDLGFLIGVFLTFKTFGTVSFSELKDIIMGAEALEPAVLSAITVITIALFVGVCGKSAQIPLYVWLPDAMAGPTPVSALIHAATMVTAGVYLMTRTNFLYFLSPVATTVVAVVGALTAFFAATMAITQTDIKKVLAYSTVSQLGFMVLACGAGAFGAGVFHLFTHACFKALLFLGAGSVIVAMHHKQDMREMGGLKSYMPMTHVAFLAGVLAIIGTPGLSGFFSKDEILWFAYLKSPVLWGIGVISAALTAFYMVRLYCLTFLGQNRADHHTQEHIHETPAYMWGVLGVLGALSVSVGWLGIPAVLGGSNLLHHFFEPIIQIPPLAAANWAALTSEHSHSLELALMSTSTVIALSAAGVSYFMYRNGPSATAAAWADRFPGAYRLLNHKYFVDEWYEANVVVRLREMSMFLYRIVDVKIVDGIVNAAAQIWSLMAGLLSFRMTGSLHRHGMAIIIGLVCLVGAILF